jgi:hypothetical protein
MLYLREREPGAYHNCCKREHNHQPQCHSAHKDVPRSYVIVRELGQATERSKTRQDKTRQDKNPPGGSAGLSQRRKCHTIELDRVVLAMRMHVDQREFRSFALGLNRNNVLVSLVTGFQLDNVACIVTRALQLSR